MEHEKKALLAQKKAQLKVREQREEIQQYKDRLTKSIEDFSQKYRYADEAEEIKLGKFISKLDFAQPGQLSIQEACPYPHKNVYLCFLMGTEALFQIFIFGKYDDILRDYDEWEVFSPCLLLVDEILFIILISMMMAKSWNHKYHDLFLRWKNGGGIMNFNEAMQMLGNKLQGKYGHLGFKYKKSDKTLTRHSKNFTYMIAFSSFGGNTKDSISIEACYIINSRPYDPYGYAKPDINTQPLFYSLRNNEIYLDIGNEEKIDNTFEIVCQWMDKLLIPKMNELCATE